MASPESISEAQLRTRARRAYERGRANRAVMAAAGVGVVVIVGVLMNPRPLSAGIAAALAMTLAAGFVWRGRGLGRGVSPGVLAGALPLVSAFAARNWAHWCTGDGCVSLCVPACVASGLLAGYLVSRWARTTEAGPVAWASAAGLAFTVGAVGCACIGYAGIAGLGIGLMFSTLPTLVVARLARAS